MVDGVDLNNIDVDQWRKRLSGAFQDFLRLEASAGTIVGVGDPDSIDDTDRIDEAVDRGGARPVIERLDGGLDAHVGKTYADGAELSGGQWQRMAIARSMMPRTPICLILDEPTAALDPEAEQRIFDSYLRAAGEIGEQGAVTVLISHRFSSVRMADFIVVLDEGRIVESGGHAELLAVDGHYARMYRHQAEAYS